MAARKKSKKPTSSKAKKTGALSRAKPASRRPSKATSLSSARKQAGKSKPASKARVAHKAAKPARTKAKTADTKLLKRKRKTVGTAGAAKRPAKAAQRKAAGAKTPRKTITKTVGAVKAPSTVRAHVKEREIKAAPESRSAIEIRAAADKGAAAHGGVKPGAGQSAHGAVSAESTQPAKPAAPAAKVHKAGGSEEALSSVKTLKGAGQRQGFKLSEFVVYPAHGVGQIVAIEEQEVAGFRLELFVINFSKDKLTLRVPTSKVAGVGMRKISDADTARRSLEILTGRARIKRTMWSRRAQEYETKINSGDINAIAEVVRDLYRSEAQPEQSYSERQLYEAALDRMVREIAAVQKSNEIDALKAVEAQLQKGQSRAPKAAAAQTVAGEIEQAA